MPLTLEKRETPSLLLGLSLVQYKANVFWSILPYNLITKVLHCNITFRWYTNNVLHTSLMCRTNSKPSSARYVLYCQAQFPHPISAQLELRLVLFSIDPSTRACQILGHFWNFGFLKTGSEKMKLFDVLNTKISLFLEFMGPYLHHFSIIFYKGVS